MNDSIHFAFKYRGPVFAVFWGEILCSWIHWVVIVQNIISVKRMQEKRERERICASDIRKWYILITASSRKWKPGIYDSQRHILKERDCYPTLRFQLLRKCKWNNPVKVIFSSYLSWDVVKKSRFLTITKYTKFSWLLKIMSIIEHISDTLFMNVKVRNHFIAIDKLEKDYIT